MIRIYDQSQNRRRNRNSYNASAMIEIKLNELLEARGQSLYALAQETGVRYATLWGLSNNATKMIPLNVLDQLCETLKCQPGDLITHVAQKRKKGQ